MKERGFLSGFWTASLPAFLGVCIVLFGFVGKSWARCEDCPVPFSVLTGSWIIADNDKKMILIVDPEPHPGKSKKVGAHLVEAGSCSVVGSGSLSHVRYTSLLALQMKDASGIVRTAFVSVSGDDKLIRIEAPCPRSSLECFWADVSKRTFRRMTTEETLLPYCSALAN